MVDAMVVVGVAAATTVETMVEMTLGTREVAR